MSADAHAIRLPRARKKKRRKKPVPPVIKIFICVYLWMTAITVLNVLFAFDALQDEDYFGIVNVAASLYGLYWLVMWYPLLLRIIAYLRDDDEDE